MKKGFASDNNAGVHPELWAAMINANQGHAIGYGGDIFTHEATKLFKNEFGSETEVFFVFNGTGANVLSLTSLTQSFHSIICAETAHIEEDECGAPEKFTGCKLLPVPTSDGKITVGEVEKHLKGFGFEHHSQPKVISISQATELGTIYHPVEIRALADLAHLHNMYLHVDGARIANAAVALDLPFSALTKDCGVDALSFGGTKNGMLMGEAALFFNPELCRNTKYLRKQSMQLYSKMRFVSAQFLGYFNNDLWKRNALQANNMARLLEQEIKKIPQITLSRRVEANGVFAIVPREIIQPLQQEYFFYVWNDKTSEVRWMTSFDTTEEDIHDFVALIRKLTA